MKEKLLSGSDPARDMTDAIASEFLSSNLHVDVKRGHIELMGHPVMLFRFEFLAAIQKQLEETIGASAKGILYLAGQRAAEEVLPAMADRLKELPPGRDSSVALRRMSDTWATIGVGRAMITQFEPEVGRFTFRIENGTLPAAYGPADKPVCHLWAGWAAGVAKQLFGGEAQCEEIRCLAVGDPACEFVIKPHP